MTLAEARAMLRRQSAAIQARRLTTNSTTIEEMTMRSVIMGYFRHPDFPGDQVHEECGQTWHVHGWIDSTYVGGDGITVCPADTGPFQGQP